MRKRKHLGHTDEMADEIVEMLRLGLIFGFILGVLSIFKQYMGALACYTAVFAPIGTLGGIVLNSVVKKSQAENTFRGKGIKYAQAEAAGFVEADNSESPVI